MPDILRLGQIIYVDTVAHLLVMTNASLGDYAFAADVKTYFCFNGTTWKAMGTANPTPPSVVVGPGAGTGASVELIGSNTDGLITFTQGALGVANGKILELTLANGIEYPNGLACTFAAANANFAQVTNQLFVTTTKNKAALNLNGLALSAGQVFKGYYKIGGY